MNPPNLLFAELLFVSGMVCLAVVILLCRKSIHAPGAKAMIVWLSGLAWWDITYAIFWADLPAPVPYFWLDITLIGTYVVPAAILIFAVDFAQYQGRFRNAMILALCIEPLFVFIMQWTDAWHNLYFAGLRMQNTTSILFAGPVFWFNVNYSYLVLLIAVGIHAVRFVRRRGLYRRQLGLILTAIVLPWIVNILAVAGLGFAWHFDATPFLFTVTALAIALGVFRYQLLDLMPIAQHLLLENMTDGVVVLDMHGRVVEINPATEKWLGCSLQDVHGRKAEEVFAGWPILTNEFKNVDHAHKELLLDEAAQSWLEVRISPLLDRHNHKVGALIIARDISRSKQDQRALKAAHDELELHVQERTAQLRNANISLARALKARDEFLAAISHELRTPLTSILGMAELLQMPLYGTLSEKQYKATLTIQNSGQRLLTLINDVLDYTKFQASEVRLDSQPCSLENVCQSALQTILPETRRKHQQTCICMDPEEITLSTDSTQLQQLLQHLLLNATKFTPDVGQVGIEVAGDPDARQVSITVWDTGIGIPAQDFPRLFRPFVQIDGGLARQYEGIGLGLALAKQRSHLLGGTIEVHSVVGKGSQFKVTLPWN